MINELDPREVGSNAGLGAGAEAWEQMRAAVLDALIVGHIYRAEHETNPLMALADLLAWETQIALDPAVSSAAANLIRRYTTPTPGPYKATEFKGADGAPNAGVLSERTGSAVCWASGRSESEEYANARRIADALNRMDRGGPEAPNT